MKNRIILIGNDKFIREAYFNKEFIVPTKKSYLDSIYKAYDVDNLSNYELTSKKALSLLSSFVSKNDYDMCLISVGNNDFDLDEYKINLQNIVNMLLCNGIMPILCELDPNGSDTVRSINSIMNELRVKNEINYKLYGDCLKLQLA